MDHTVDTNLARKVYELVGFNDAKALKELPKSNCPLLVRDDNQETPLSVCLRGEPSEGVVPKEDILETLEALLEKGAAESVFVKGYKPASLVCTLPMAEQPESSFIAWPKPIKLDSERLAMLDKALAEHIKKIVDREARLTKSDLASESPVEKNEPKAAPKPKPAFNHYPPDLKVGDIVRRGPDWHYSGQDERNGVQCAGIVTNVSSSSRYVVQWCTDPRNPNTAFNTDSYQYDPGSNVDLFLVNPKDFNAYPKNVSATSRGGERFQVGDKVRLAVGQDGSSLIQKNRSDLVGASQLCLGKSSDALVGVVVESNSSPSLQLNDCVVKVMELKNGRFCEYGMTDLTYADGSSIGIPKADLISPLPISDPSGKLKKPAFKRGDVVMLRPKAKDQNGCLSQPHMKLTGTVQSFSMSGVQVVSQNQNQSGFLQPVGVYYSRPNSHIYDASDLMLAGNQRESLYLMPGDLVELNSTFTDNNGAGWCLGTVTDPKNGVVRFATVPSTTGGDQREVVVSSLDEPHKQYFYKSSWLQRAPNDGTTKFKVGDRVRLDISTWSEDGIETAGKCLGLPRSGYYGIVCALGPTRDDVQRNIEVIAASGPKAGEVSLYPAYSIHRATRVSVLTDADTVSLADTLTQLFQGTKFQDMNCAKLIEKSGQYIWNILSTVPIFKRDDLHSAWRKWDLRRSMCWPQDEPNVLENCFGYRMRPKEPAVADANRTANLADKVETPVTWKCKNKKCLISGGFENPMVVSKCGVCKVPAPKWTCECCTSKNKVNSLTCVSCYITKAESDELNVDFIRKKKEEMEIKKAQREKEVQAFLDLINAETDKLASKVESVLPPLYLHPGTFVGCGGNPEGFARCEGKSVCSVGVDCCVNCGAGTHWSCCGSTDQDSFTCPLSVTNVDDSHKKASRNAKVLSLESQKLVPVSQINGYFPFATIQTWFCEACTTSNPNDGPSKCTSCDKDRPAPHSYEDVWKELAAIDVDDENEITAGVDSDEMMSETEAIETPDDLKTEIASKLRALYAKYDRKNLHKVPMLLEKFVGHENKLLLLTEKRFEMSPLLKPVDEPTAAISASAVNTTSAGATNFEFIPASGGFVGFGGVAISGQIGGAGGTGIPPFAPEQVCLSEHFSCILLLCYVIFYSF